MWTGRQSEPAPIPSRREWLDYLGEYRVSGADGSIQATVFLRNGQLYVRYNIACGQPGMRLTAFAPGLFYTAAGVPVSFHKGGMMFGRIASVKAA